ncbi:MAG: fructosamine kinase family protein [Streptosporangiaceae bacterium]
MTEPRDRLAAAAGSVVTSWQPAGGDHGARHYRAALADGRELFVKAAAGGPGVPALEAEARGLRWLAEAGDAPVAEIVCVAGGLLALGWLPPGRSDRAAAERFGRELAGLHGAGPHGAGPRGAGPHGAGLHGAGPARFGAPWPGYIASLPLPNEEADAWPGWYARFRLLPYVKIAADAGVLSPADVRLIESVADQIGGLAGPAEPPARIHGDCWTGNVLWSGGRGWLIDPAAHGGHRESDLAMLALFGAPHLDRVLAAYDETAPLAAGWQARVPLHQLHPLLVHVCLFGGGYREAALSAARAALSA